MHLSYSVFSLVVFIIGHVSCGSSPVQPPDSKTSPTHMVSSDTIVSMQISTVNLKILTFNDVPCGEFDKHFGNIKRTEVKDKSMQDSIMSMLAETKTLNKTFPATPDTRGVLAVKYSSKVSESYCFDDQLITIGDTTYYSSPALKAYLWLVSDTE